MLTLKRVYEPAAPEDGLRVLVERRWPWRLDKRCDRSLGKASRAQRRAASVVRRAACTMGRVPHAVCARVGSASRKTGLLESCCGEKRPVTLLFSARDQVHNCAAVLREVLCCGPQLGVAAANMSHAELLRFLNSLLGNSRATIKEAKAILQQTATRMLGIQRDEAYASAVLIQLVNGLGGRPDYGIEPTDDIAGGAGLASRLALFGRDQIRLADELESNLRRVADDRIRHRLQKLLKARVPNFRRLDGKPHLALAQKAPPGRD